MSNILVSNVKQRNPNFAKSKKNLSELTYHIINKIGKTYLYKDIMKQE